MTLKLECPLNCNVTQIGNVTEIGISLKLECYSNWNVSQIKMSLKLEYRSNLNVNQIKM